jgi:hypothetical protein
MEAKTLLCEAISNRSLNQKETAMIKTLTPEDIRTFLKQLSTAIELDQVHVDALAPERFSPAYSDGTWRAWRRDHRVFIDRLLLTADAIPPAMLRELTGIAIAHKPELIGSVVLELFAEVVSGSCPPEDHGTAERFFGWLIKQLNDQPGGNLRHESARASILQWLPVSDPLRIAQDPERGYGQPH